MTYNTTRKSEILTLLSSEKEKAFTAEEICGAILKGGKGKSTVYRIISNLVENGKIKRISDQKSRHVKYQYIGEKVCAEHLHLKCRDCGKLIHLDKKMSDGIISSLALGGFLLDQSEFLVGRCNKCADRKEI